ncbi:nitric oxide reductase large subunit [Vibrio sp. UCD-FRSSP16_10]|uniref:nitric-oxide reductase large subunit n=1 Tax=unclassified Vibrio TaxID=2614977 RepID=UPI0007FD453F|nr:MULTISPECIES: nitric-oxide reductase large subunit [unclassified Vibrio]OBT14007.1 nitric oxide reductase large subunit [Vibrio sp. UCD-FRSSP16_30]OBT22888.1 nitric oxide reductase large subunit [Vibrio sp. UCD-FRSSP16_10]
MERRTKWALSALICISVFSFTVLLLVGKDIYRQSPPMPQQIVDTQGNVILTYQDLDTGQLAWRSMGGHQLGSIWGHGAYIAPDWTADWIHKEQGIWLNLQANSEFQTGFDALTIVQQDALLSKYKREIRENTYNPDSDTIVISPTRAKAIQSLTDYYVSLFGDGAETAKERNDYAMKDNTLINAERREAFAAFVFWSAWAAVTERPGETYTYTNNWPYDPSIGNTITGDSVFWSVISIVLLLGAVAALVWYHAALKEEEIVGPATDPLMERGALPSQKATYKYFYTAIALFVVQIFLGGLTAHYGVEGQEFYGLPIAEIFPYSLTRTWHTQIAVFWIATIWLGTGLFVATALSKYEAPYQKLGINVLWVALLIVVVGSMAGEYLAIQQNFFDLDTNFYFGHQGQEYVDLGRFWQILLFIGLLLWVFLVTMAVKPILTRKDEQRPIFLLLYISIVCIGFFYAAAFMVGKHENLAINEYWRWWVVHLWVEGFFETFATAILALIFVRLGLIRGKSASFAVLFTTAIFLTGGILGTLHHLYFTGTPTSVIAWGATFSALEVVPLTLIGFEAYETYSMRNRAPWMARYKWAIMFFVASAFWNLFGAGVLGFLINPPISLYFIQGLNTTATHAHGAFMGVYGMLGIGLMLICLRHHFDLDGITDRILKYSFWSLNIGLAAMLLMSLLPIGLIQFKAVLEKGYWYARSSEVIHSPEVTNFVWARMVGDVLFIIGGCLMALFVLRLMLKSTKHDDNVES